MVLIQTPGNSDGGFISAQMGYLRGQNTTRGSVAIDDVPGAAPRATVKKGLWGLVAIVVAGFVFILYALCPIGKYQNPAKLFPLSSYSSMNRRLAKISSATWKLSKLYS